MKKASSTPCAFHTTIITLAVSLLALTIFASPGLCGSYAATRHPIVLVPGVTGFDALLGAVDYWYGMVDHLEKEGAKVYQVALTGWNGVYTEDVLDGHDDDNLRGPQLEKLILAFMKGKNRWGKEFEKVNIIAHSHGSTTSRYFLNRHPDKVASLTTIAGPHKGTPTADYAWYCMENDIQSFLADGIDFFMGDLIAFLSGNWEYIGSQDTWLTLNHFQADGISRFNRDFPCPGLPYSLDASGSKIYCEGIEGGYGEACQFDGEPSGIMTYDPETGEQRTGHIYFYSWTGNIGHKNMTNLLDPLDVFMIATNLFNEGYDYYGDADSFIPVASARFGHVLNTDYYWNHLDEINHSLGIRRPWTADPRTVICTHANRLKNLGL